MANVSNIVKIMNFHSLLRVDKSKRKAEKYREIENELSNMIVQIIYNKNLTLDKKILKVNQKGMDLNIYVGNDLGFCSNFNSSVVKMANDNLTAKKIMIGKKIFSKKDNVILNISKEEFYDNYNKIGDIITQKIDNNELKSISVIYNHYYSVSNIKLEVKKIFPIDFTENKEICLDDDFVIEADITSVLKNLIILYICYEIKIIETNSWASENVMREKITRESLKKIETMDEEKQREVRKQKKYIAFKKQISNYRK